MRDCRSSQKGFTLIEVLVAMTIFAIGLLAIAGMQVTALRGNSSSQTLSAATALASGILEEILVLAPDDARVTTAGTFNWDFDPDTAGVQASQEIAGAGSYSATYAVELNYNGVNNVTRITVTVSGGGRTLAGAGQRQVALVGFKKAV